MNVFRPTAVPQEQSTFSKPLRHTILWHYRTSPPRAFI